MNAFLANWLGRLNAVIAVVIILAGLIVGGSAGAVGGDQAALAGFVLGGIAGAIVAVLLCGLLALLIGIRDELVAMRRVLEATPANERGSGRTAA